MLPCWKINLSCSAPDWANRRDTFQHCWPFVHVFLHGQSLVCSGPGPWCEVKSNAYSYSTSFWKELWQEWKLISKNLCLSEDQKAWETLWVRYLGAHTLHLSKQSGMRPQDVEEPGDSVGQGWPQRRDSVWSARGRDTPLCSAQANHKSDRTFYEMVLPNGEWARESLI